jgi:hypothetical protein
MVSWQRMVIVLGSCAILALGLIAFAWTLGTGSSEAQQAAMLYCPQTGKWSIAVWEGSDGTDTGQALATCGETSVAAAYYIDPETQQWERWFAGRPEVSSLGTLDHGQGVLALGGGGSLLPTATTTLPPTAAATLPPSVTPTLTPTGAPMPVAFQKGDEDLTFHMEAASFELQWMVMGEGWVELTVLRQQDGSAVCASEKLWAPTSGGKVCGGGPGDFRLDVAVADDCVACNDWAVSITPQ